MGRRGRPVGSKHIFRRSWDRESLAWAAGFIDGEGCFSRSRGNSFGLGVHQIHREVLEKLRTALGMGVVRGPYNHKSSAERVNYRPYYDFSLSSFETVQMTMILLWPWMGSIKRAQAIRAVSVYTAEVG